MSASKATGTERIVPSSTDEAGFDALQRLAAIATDATREGDTHAILRAVVEALGASAARWFVGRECVAHRGFGDVSDQGLDPAESAPWNVTLIDDMDVVHRDLGHGSEPSPMLDAIRLAGHGHVSLLYLASHGLVELYDLPDSSRSEALMSALISQLGAISTQLDLATRYRNMRRDKDALQAIAESMTSASNEAAAIAAGLSEICTQLGWSYATMWTWDEASETLTYSTDAGMIGSTLRARSSASTLSHGQGLPGLALAEDRTVVLDTLEGLDDPRMDAQIAGTLEGVAATTIRDEGRLVGVVELGLLKGSGPVHHPVDRAETLGALGRMMGRLLGRIARTSEANRLSAIVECSAAAMIFVNPAREIEYLNPAAYALFEGLGDALDIGPAKLPGQHIDMISGESGFLEQTIAAGLPQVVTTEIQGITLSIDLQTIRADGGVIGTLLTVDDITSQLRLEANQAKVRQREAEVARLEKERHEERAAEQVRRAEETRRQAELARARAEAESLRSEALRASVQELLDVVQVAAAGNLGARVPTDGPEQIGLVGAGVQVLLDSLSSSLETIRRESQEVGSASRDIATIAEELSNNADAADASCASAATQAQRVDVCIAEVLGAADEVDSSLRQLDKRVAQSGKATARAVQSVDLGVQRVSELVQTGQAIGSMVGAIGRIAAQTKLLALNASIEAARAGSAGRGFGVVANEVKSLAREVESATRDITEQIEAIRSQSDDMQTVFGNMRDVIAELAETTGEVSERTQSQISLNGRIQNSLVEAASAAERVTDSFGPLRDQTSNAAGVARQMQDRAGRLGDVVLGLDGVVNGFTVEAPEPIRQAS